MGWDVGFPIHVLDHWHASFYNFLCPMPVCEEATSNGRTFLCNYDVQVDRQPGGVCLGHPHRTRPRYSTSTGIKRIPETFDIGVVEETEQQIYAPKSQNRTHHGSGLAPNMGIANNIQKVGARNPVRFNFKGNGGIRHR
jgi:hypothetical protein